MTREEFLDKNYERLKEMDLAIYNKAVKDLREKDNATWIEEYAPLFMEAGVNTDDMAALKKTVEPLPKRLREAFGDLKFAPSEKWKNRVYKQEFSDVDKNEFEKGLAKMKEYYDQEVSQKRAEADKEKRKREVKNWGWRNFIASDYEKERYIDNPQAALFGEQATPLSEDLLGKGEAISDLSYGAAGAVADALPGWAGMLGPAVRTARDAQHVLTDSPYQKSVGDIAMNTAADVGFSASTAWLPNFRKAKRIKGGMMPKAVGANVALEEEARKMGSDALQIRRLFSRGEPATEEALKHRNQAFRDIYDNMPDSPFKQALSTEVGKIELDGPAIAEKAQTAMNQASAALKYQADVKEAINSGTAFIGGKRSNVIQLSKDGLPVKGIQEAKVAEYDPWFQRIRSTPEMTPFQQKTKPAWVMFDKFLSGDLGGAALQEAKTLTGARSPKKAERVETPEEREEIEAIKEREAPFWEMKFKPHKDNSLMYKAWKEWADENGVEVKD